MPEDVERFHQLAWETLRRFDDFPRDPIRLSVEFVMLGLIPIAGLLLFGWSAVISQQDMSGLDERDLCVRVGVRVRNAMRDIAHGKGLLTEPVRMLVAWKGSLGEQSLVRIENTVLLHATLPSTVTRDGPPTDPQILRKSLILQRNYVGRE